MPHLSHKCLLITRGQTRHVPPLGGSGRGSQSLETLQHTITRLFVYICVFGNLHEEKKRSNGWKLQCLLHRVITGARSSLRHIRFLCDAHLELPCDRCWCLLCRSPSLAILTLAVYSLISQSFIVPLVLYHN